MGTSIPLDDESSSDAFSSSDDDALEQNSKAGIDPSLMKRNFAAAVNPVEEQYSDNSPKYQTKNGITSLPREKDCKGSIVSGAMWRRQVFILNRSSSTSTKL